MVLNEDEARQFPPKNEETEREVQTGWFTDVAHESYWMRTQQKRLLSWLMGGYVLGRHGTATCCPQCWGLSQGEQR